MADVVVIGGGPAGSALAAMAAEAGAEVTLVERKRFPRDKLCGGFVAATGCGVLQRLGVLERLTESGASPIRACRLTSRDGRVLDVPLPADALGVSRARLDLTLADRARARGADVVHGWEALEPVRTAAGEVEGVVVREVGRDETRVLRAPVVVAADGRRSRFARLVHDCPGDPARTRPASRFALQAHLSGGTQRVDGRVDLHLIRGGYAGLAPIEGRRLNLCLLIRVRELRAVGGSPDRVLSELVRRNPAADAAIGGSRPAGRWRSVGPLRFGPRRAAGGGVLLVGDAAGTVDPFAGEGISHALVSAELALPWVLRAAEHGRLDPDDARRYAEVWDRRFGAVTRRIRRLGRLLERPAIADRVLLALEYAGGSWPRRIIASTHGP